MLCGVNMRNKKVSWFRFILRRRLVHRWGLVGVACVVRRGGTGIVASVVSGRGSWGCLWGCGVHVSCVRCYSGGL